MGTEENIRKKHFDVFLGYHGTEDPNGSLAIAERLYDILSFKNKVAAFIQTKTNALGRYTTTPIVASKSKVFLFVANDNVPVDPDGEIEGDALEEMEAYYGDNSYCKETKLARVFACGGLTYEKAKNFHTMFKGVANFRVADES